MRASAPKSLAGLSSTAAAIPFLIIDGSDLLLILAIESIVALLLAPHLHGDNTDDDDDDDK